MLITNILVPGLCLGMQIQRLCFLFACAIDEAEPLDMVSQAEPENQFKRQLTTSQLDALWPP